MVVRSALWTPVASNGRQTPEDLLFAFLRVPTFGFKGGMPFDYASPHPRCATQRMLVILSEASSCIP